MRGQHISQALVRQIKDLRQRGLSLNQICLRTQIAKSTVYAYIKTVTLSDEQISTIKGIRRLAIQLANQKRLGRSRPHNRPTYLPDQWSQELVESVSHFCFDGSIQKSTSSYYNRSISLINRQQQLNRSLFGLSGKLLRRPNNVYRLDYYSVELCSYLSVMKGKLFREIESMSLDYQTVFLRAFFDDEGNVDVRYHRVRGYQKDLLILELVQRLLGGLGIAAKIDKTGSCVVVSGRRQLADFGRQINFSPGIYMNGERKNSRYGHDVEKRALLRGLLDGYESFQL